MAGPTLPTELIKEIIDLAAETPAFDYLERDWAAGVDPGTLYNLCLASRTFNKLATPHLYSHVIVPTPEREQLLCQTVNSERWTKKAEAKHVLGAPVNSFTVGEVAGSDEESVFGVSDELLEAVEATGAQRVALIGVKLGPDDVAKLTSRQFPPEYDGNAHSSLADHLSLHYTRRQVPSP